MSFGAIASIGGAIIGGAGAALGGAGAIAGGLLGGAGSLLASNPWIVSAGSSVLKTVLANQGIDEAQWAQMNSLQQQQILQNSLLKENLSQNNPYVETGEGANTRLQELLGIGGDKNSQYYGKYSQPISQKDVQLDPGYNFRFEQGLKALDNSAAARGLLMSGGQLNRVQRYGQDYASQEYSNAYNRTQQQRQQDIDNLKSLGTLGLKASGDNNALRNDYGINMNNLMSGTGNVQASASMARSRNNSFGLNDLLGVF